MKRSRLLFLCCILGLIGSLALSRYHPFGDAGLYQPQVSQAQVVANSELPQQVRSILDAKCADCHSNRTRPPIYGHFAPISWLLERDVIHARRAMNFSTWDQYPRDKRELLLAQITHEARLGAMPPLQYRVIHWNSQITASDLKALNDLSKTSAGMEGANWQVTGGDPARGKALFERRCTGCHALTQNREGPRLQGVYGRTSGTVPDFAYSAALNKTHFAWDESSLERWLTDPDALIPGNEMDFLLPNPQERRDIVSYLRQTSGK